MTSTLPEAATPATGARTSKRTDMLESRPVNLDGFVEEWPEKGLVAMESDFDPSPSVRVENGVIVEMDGRERAAFDFMDTFIADHAIDVEVAERATAIPSTDIARMLVDPGVTRAELLDITRGLTPAKLLDVVKLLNVVEIMMSMQKMRARRSPANQAHSTSARDNPIQVAADAAEAALRGFAEMETTLGVLRYAPLVAIGLQVGAQSGRGGVITQCALEEATELDLGMRGITGYAETISVYGTESVFVDGDDTPWSKSFLASAYASRGIKMRFTSGTGSEVQMGNAEGSSMLFLGSNLDVEDYDDWNTIQRDLQIDGGLRHVREPEILAVREKAARAMQAVFAELDLPRITDEEIEAATYANSSADYPLREVLEDLKGAQSVMDRGITGLDLVRILERTGFHDVAENLLQVLRQRVSGDLLQTSAILDENFVPQAAINDANDYAGPGTGYRLTGERWNALKKLRHVTSAENPEEEVS
ncbi:hypothetical protein FVA95_23270 [Pseudonocardia sp. EV170527-09]|uniref:propanediol/glycerol family dehydratase large subunit n=1 Tax=Pseudonocardia sp. EV170527-09 TaxID=2603411 RepID=UPI0011F2A0CE|nr:propanediol/glycerol family dehydratase large subunit [Pseudonocardia sp. EV170527-09]KAA1019135.1 hypothetical protein FVA95_23270 [Pseudonocardia sp. EV170527-09]